MKLPTLWRRAAKEDLALRGPEDRALTLRDPDGWRELFGTQTASGIVVTADAALGHPAVLGAVRLLAELLASLPLLVYERTREGKRRAESHPVYQLLHDAPNEAMTPFVFKETLGLHLLLHGNAYALILREQGRPVALWPLHPTRVSLVGDGGLLRYQVVGQGATTTYAAADVIHIPILASDGLRGQSPVQVAREAIGAALAAEEHAARYFANGAQPSGVLVHPGTLTPEAAKRLKDSWNAAHGGAGRHGTAVLEGGMKFEPITSTAKDAQLIEARQLALRTIAAALRIPPHLLDPTARGTYANVETQSLEFLTFSLQPLLTRFEEAFSRKLFGPGEPYFAEFLTDGLLRADTATRYAAYETGIRAGFLTVAEVRQRENLPALPQPASERHAHGRPEVRALSAHDRLQAEIEGSLREAFGRIVERESRDVLAIVESLAGKRADLGQLALLLRDYYEKAAYMADEILQPLEAAVEAARKLSFTEVSQAYHLGLFHKQTQMITPEAFAAAQERLTRKLLADMLRQHAGISETQVLAAARSAFSDAELLEAVERTVAEWAGVRVGKAAQLHATVIRNETALEVYRQAGVTKLRWVANAGACAYCQRLDGKVVGLGEPFVAIGEALAGPGGREDRPMVARFPRIRPPVHLGCTCSISIAG